MKENEGEALKIMEENLKVGWKSVVFGIIGGAVGAISWAILLFFLVGRLSCYIVGGGGPHLGALTPIFAFYIGIIGGLLNGSLLGFLIGSGVSLCLKIPIIFLTSNTIGYLLAFPCIVILAPFSASELIFEIMCLLPGLLSIIGVVLGTLGIISLDSHRLGISIKWRNLPLLLICYIIVFIIVLVSGGFLLLNSKISENLGISGFLISLIVIIPPVGLILINLTKYSVFKRKDMVYEQGGSRNYPRRILLVFLIIFGLAVAETVGALVLIGISGCPKISKENIPFDTLSDVKAQIEKLYSLKPVERGKAAHQIGTIGTRATSAVPFLISIMHDNSPISLGEYYDEDRTYVNREVIRALGKIKDPRAVEPLINILIHNTLFKGYCFGIRYDAVMVLGEIKDPRAIEPLINALKDENEYFRKEVAKALKNITEKDFGQSYEKWREWWEKNK